MTQAIHPNTLKAVQRKHRKKATDMQVVALQLHAQGLNKAQALKRAGYSKSMQHVPKKVFTSQAIVTAVDKFKLELKDLDLTTEYIALKLKELLTADKLSTNDYQIQLKALEMLKGILIDSETKKQDPQLKRKVTLEEFVGTPNSYQTTTEVINEVNVTSTNNNEDDLQPLQDLVGSENELKPHIND